MDNNSRFSDLKFISDMISEPRLLLIILMDLSDSMSHDGKIAIANRALRQIRQALLNDPIATRRIEISLIGFSSGVTLLQPFTPISKFEPVDVSQTGSCTNMGQAICDVVSLGKSRIRQIQKLGGKTYQLHILMISDGMPTDDIQPAIELLQTEEAKGSRGHVIVTSIGIGDFDRQTLLSISPNCYSLNEVNFEKLMDWYAEYLRIVSNSRVSDTVEIPRLPEGLTRLYQEERN